MIQQNLDELQTRFRDAFSFKRPWKRRRSSWFWVDLQNEVVRLEGPLDAIVRTGGCDYVYDRDDFVGVSDPLTLRAWFQRLHLHLENRLSEFQPKSADEELDLAMLQTIVAEMWDVVEAALEVEQARRESANGGSQSMQAPAET